MEQALVESERQGAVATITLNRPETLNALNRDLRRELAQALDAALGDSGVGAVVLTAQGRAFSVGQDLQEMQRLQQEGVGVERVVKDEYMPIFHSLRYSAKPVVAALPGPAVGGGMSLALAADIRLGTPQATLVAGFIKAGLGPDTGSSFLLARSVGLAKAMELCLTGDALSAEQALALGLVRAILPERASLLAAAQELAATLAAGPRRALAEVRQVLYQAMELPWPAVVEAELEAQMRLGATADHEEAVAAFLEKRRPHFE